MRISDWSSDVCSSDLEIGELGANLIAMRRFDRFVHRAAALARQRPGDRHGRRLGETRDRMDSGVEEAVYVGLVQPELGQRVERAPRRNRIGEEGGVDAAGARPGQYIAQDPKLDYALVGDGFEQLVVDVMTAAGRWLSGLTCTTGDRKSVGSGQS